MKIVVTKHSKYVKSWNKYESKFIDYTIIPDKLEYLVVLQAISDWKNFDELVQFAQNRHGYCNSDSYSGITYPEDLDEYDIDVEKINIPHEYVLARAAYAYPEAGDVLIKEGEYLEILKQILFLNDKKELSKKIESMLIEK